MMSISQMNHPEKSILMRTLFTILLVAAVVWLIWSFTFSKIIYQSPGYTIILDRASFTEKLQKEKLNISALVFYGRRQYVEILSCYLEKNLVENGGLLSEVIFVLKTNNKNDVSYLHQLVAQHPNVYSIKKASNLGWTFDTHYRNLDPNRYYVKMDDDILYIHPNAIESMLAAKLDNPAAMFISANVINHPDFGVLHLHLGALINVDGTLPTVPRTGLPDYNWEKSEYAKLHHRSFLQHHKNKTLNSYVFPIWDYNALAYNRWSINFFLFKGDEVRDVGPGDDEHQISITIPKKYRRHTLVVGSAIVVHFAYRPQRSSGLKDNDFIPEYRDLAQEICNSTRRIEEDVSMMSGP